MPESTLGSMSAEDLQLNEHAAVDTVANYVKEDLTLKDFFRREGYGRRETFAIQAAENEGKRVFVDEPEQEQSLEAYLDRE